MATKKKEKMDMRIMNKLHHLEIDLFHSFIHLLLLTLAHLFYCIR